MDGTVAVWLKAHLLQTYGLEEELIERKYYKFKSKMILFILLISRHGKIRLQKFFKPTPVKKRT